MLRLSHDALLDPAPLQAMATAPATSDPRCPYPRFGVAGPATRHATPSPRRLWLGPDRVLKVAETPEELDRWFELRKRVYVDELGHVSPDRQSAAERALGQEFDAYDASPSTLHVVCMDYAGGRGVCVGGLRGLRGALPVEGVLDLAPWRRVHPGIEAGEASRLMVAPEARHDRTLLLEILRMGFDLSRDLPFKFCTTMGNTVALYRRLGFTPLLPGPVESDGYRLRGAWLPMRLDHRTIQRVADHGDWPDELGEFSPGLYDLVTKPIRHEHDRLVLEPDRERLLPVCDLLERGQVPRVRPY